jgi:hypothetical protein
MPVTSITPSQPAQAPQAIKKNDNTAARKQVEIQDDEAVKNRKLAEEKNAQLQKTQEAKASVNTSGQKVGTLINISA